MFRQDELCPLGRFLFNAACGAFAAPLAHGFARNAYPASWQGWPLMTLTALLGAVSLALCLGFRFRLRKRGDWYYNAVSGVPAVVFTAVFLWSCRQ